MCTTYYNKCMTITYIARVICAQFCTSYIISEWAWSDFIRTSPNARHHLTYKIAGSRPAVDLNMIWLLNPLQLQVTYRTKNWLATCTCTCTCTCTFFYGDKCIHISYIILKIAKFSLLKYFRIAWEMWKWKLCVLLMLMRYGVIYLKII